MALLNVQVLTASTPLVPVTDSLTIGAVAPFTVTTTSIPRSLPTVTTGIQGTNDIAVVNLSTAVVGTLTTFTTLSAGNLIQFTSQLGVVYTVLSIVDDTHLTLTSNYTGTTNAATSMLFQFVNIAAGVPTPSQFVVNYSTGVLTFNASEASTTVSINYNALFYTPTVGALSADIELWGGAGAGGNALGSTPLNYSVGSGGGAGGYARYFFPTMGSGPYQISIGTGGGTPVLGATFDGGNTFFDTGSIVITAHGGKQGNTIQVGASVPEISVGGAGGLISTNGTFNSAGSAGQEGLILSSNYILGGAGGSTSLEGAGAALGITGTGAGNNATPNTGSGGGGAINTNLTTLTFGGWGSAGVIIISEYDTDGGNLTGDVTSVLNVTTLAHIPAISGASLLNLTAANIGAGTAPINITGNSSTVTTNANLTGPITSVGNATTIVGPLPAISGAALTNLTAANISAGTSPINVTGNAATSTLAATVTTNANLTGDVTSVGNATTVDTVGGVTAADVATTVTTVANGVGVNFGPGAVTSITVVNGIITAIS